MISTKDLNSEPCLQYDILSNNLKYLMSRDAIDATVLGQKIGVAASTINGIRRGGGNPTLGTIAAIAQYFQLSIGDLTESAIDGNSASQKQRAHHISLIAMKDIAAYLKNNAYAKQMIIAELSDANQDDFFAVSIDNNSLYPLFEKGTLFIVKKTDKALDGDIVLVDFGSNSYCFRRIFIESNNHFFKTLTETLKSPGSRATKFTIIGVVIKAIQNFE